MKWIDNFSENHLLYNRPVKFTFINEEDNNTITSFHLRWVTVEEIYFDEDIKIALSVLSSDLTTLQKNFPIIQNLKSKFNLFIALSLLSNNLKDSVYNKIIYLFDKIGFKIVANNNILFINELVPLTEEIFDKVVNYILIGTKLLDIKEIDLDPRMKILQDKINRIKNQKKKNSVDTYGYTDNFMVLTYEFGYKPEEILNMNMYQIDTILSYTSNIIGYKISTVSFGNGLTKKFKYMTKKENK